MHDLNNQELRALLRQETRKFLLLLERDGTIEELEVLRKRIQEAGNILKEKELRSDKNPFNSKE